MRQTTLVLVLVFLIVLAGSVGWAAPREMDLRVTEPGASSEWIVGSSSAVKWSFRGNLGQSVSIRLQRIGWVNARLVLAETAPIGANRSGSFKWNIPADLPPGADYTISVTAENGIGDMSGEFKLTAGKNPVTQISLEPLTKGGDRWSPGSSVVIRWTYAGSPGQTIQLALIKKAEGTVTSIASSVPLGIDGKGRFEWKVPALPAGKDYYLAIASNSNAFYQDMGKDPVSIIATR